MIQFKYNGKIYDTSDLEKKLKKMKLTIDDIEIVTKTTNEELDNSIKLYYFKRADGCSITSIYPDLNDLVKEINIDEYIRVDRL